MPGTAIVKLRSNRLLKFSTSSKRSQCYLIDETSCLAEPAVDIVVDRLYCIAELARSLFALLAGGVHVAGAFDEGQRLIVALGVLVEGLGG